MTDYATTDLSDAANGNLRHLAPIFSDFGGRVRFSGPVTTLVTFEDNTKIRAAVETAGEGRVLVVDGGGSMNCALFGGNLAALAAENGWAGIVINGCVRDRAELQAANVGIKALAAHPKKAIKATLALMMCRCRLAGSRFIPATAFTPMNGILIADHPLSL